MGRNTMNARCEFKCKDGYLPSRTDLSDSCRIRLDGEVKDGWWYYGEDPVKCIKTPPADDPPAAEGWCTEDDWIEITRIESERYSNFKHVGKFDTKEECEQKCMEHGTADHAVWVASGANTNFCLCFWTVTKMYGEWTIPPMPGSSNALVCKKPE